MHIEEAIAGFFPKNEISGYQPYGSGHIHRTYLLWPHDGNSQYILQEINRNIFPEVKALQDNISRVTNHLKKVNENKNDSHQTYSGLEIIATPDGQPFFSVDELSYWRVFRFIPNSRTFDTIPSTAHAYEGGRALGKFLGDLDGFHVDSISITLPGFHDLGKRLEQFEKALQSDSASRISEVKNEVGFVRQRAEKLLQLFSAETTNSIPRRITHNDPKFNNILFDPKGKSICIIDLDTVMPGFVFHDFGDAIRTGAASSIEDEPDTQQMFIDLELFAAYAEGFLQQMRHILTTTELSTLSLAPQYMTFIIGLRFLTDFINGDIYFKTAHPQHNLQRWYAQKALLLSMEKSEHKMAEIIQQIINQQP